jgi:KipI family sensor histidine kinase inhibitor
LSRFKLTYKQYGERSILIEWPSKIDKYILEDLIFYKEKLEKSLFKEIVYINQAYNSILINYNSIIENIYDDILLLKDIYCSEINVIAKPSTLWRIPVCYDDEFALDLDTISTQKKLSKNDIITLHSNAIYTVFFIGFLPGFLYLGGLNKELYVPRKATPRLKIEKGAVGIGGTQTGIYPNKSPGGWNIIGNSPINFFDITKCEPCFARSGDKTQFYSIPTKKYNDIKTLVEADVYQIEGEVLRG